MRKALNDNPMVQIAVLGMVAVVFAFILFTSVLKKEDTAATPTDPAATATSATGGTAAPANSAVTPTDPSATAVAPTTSAPTAAAPSPGDSIADGLSPTKGLPSDVLVAFAKDQTIALLVIDPKGMSDRKVEEYTNELRSRNDVEVFVVDVKDIADYSRITIGATVSRVPALVVIQPRKLSGAVPTSTVSYGFRDAASINQAVDDALYDGRQISSYP